IAPIATALAARGTPYRGVLYAGLMKTSKGWRVLEYNARFGDPEAEVTLPRLEGDFARLMVALGEGKLAEYVAANPLRFSGRASRSSWARPRTRPPWDSPPRRSAPSASRWKPVCSRRTGPRRLSASGSTRSRRAACA